MLVVETVGIPAERFYDWFGGGPHSDRLHTIERYSTNDDGNWLLLELTFDDPETLREPLVLTKRWRRTRDVELLSHRCSDRLSTHSVGTRRLSSSNQFCTMTMLAGVSFAPTASSR